MIKKILNILHPLLKPIFNWYLSKERNYTYKKIRITVTRGVFHPGFFFSTTILLDYLDKENLHQKKVLELGAGSGLISIFCEKKGAQVTASDISEKALENIRVNSLLNNSAITIVESDLFTNINPNEFDSIIINPPYYPKEIKTEAEFAWHCGPHFEFFQRLFEQLQSLHGEPIILMILSQDCNIEKIKSIATRFGLKMHLTHQQKKWGEWNYIFKIKTV